MFKIDSISSPPERPPYKGDDRVSLVLDPKFYSKTGYDVAHLAPNAGIFNRYGRNAQVETFLLSNFGPQTTRLNRGPWKVCEHWLTDGKPQVYEELYGLLRGQFCEMVFTSFERYNSNSGSLSKILPDSDGQALRSMAFIMPNKDTMGSTDQFFDTSLQSESEIPAYRGLKDDVLEVFSV